MPERTVAAGFARALVEFVASKGADLEALSERARVDTKELQATCDRVPFTKYVALMRAGKELCNDPALALHFGESPYAETGIGCVIGSFAENGAEGFALFNRYSRLNIEAECDGDRYALVRSAGELWVVDTRRNANDFPELTEFSFTCTVRVLRQLWGERETVKAVHVTHAAPEYRAEYDRVFGVPVVFESERNALVLADDAWLTRSNPVASRYVFEILSAHVESRLTSLERSRTTRGCVERLLMRMIHTGEATVDAVAGEMGLSRQTLFRRLKAEGTSFEKVLNELRRKMAFHYLREKKISVNEAAYLLGYSDAATFSRAFKRWTGSTPRRAQRFSQS